MLDGEASEVVVSSRLSLDQEVLQQFYSLHVLVHNAYRHTIVWVNKKQLTE